MPETKIINADALETLPRFFIGYPRFQYEQIGDTVFEREIWPQHERCRINGRLVNSIVYKRTKYKRDQQWRTR